MKPQALLSQALAISIGLVWTTALAAEPEDPDWPCEQALVSEVSAAVVWDGPSLEALKEGWESDERVAALVQRLTSRDADPSDDEALIEVFADAQPPAERNLGLTMLFAGVLEVLNTDRRKLNDGILRYSRDQERRAQALGARLAEMVQLESDESEAARRRLAELGDRMELEQRVFDDREKSIPFLCTRPRAVEQRIGELARAISAQLQ